MPDWTFITAEDDELDEALKGKAVQPGHPWPRHPFRRLSSEGVGLLIEQTQHPGRSRPVAVIVSDELSRRLFGRYSQLRSDMSPISAWTHVLNGRQFEQLKCETRTADLGGFEASWIGLVVAEAVILSDRPLSSLKLAACLATPTYAVARAYALWPSESLESVLIRYDQCQKLLRATDGSANKLRNALVDIWRALLNVSVPVPRDTPSELRRITRALSVLLMARESNQDEGIALQDVFDFPEAQFLNRLGDMPAESRLRHFDRLVAEIDNISDGDRGRRSELQFLAGYLATVAAGGAPSLGLAEHVSARWPQIVAWAYVIGGLGEAVTWTSSFDGLGRLVARDLMRPFHLGDAPTSDFALEEAVVLVDRALRDPFVHLRVKQTRIMSVALLPGVNVAVPFAETQPEIRTREPTPRSDLWARMPLPALADALWPYMESRLREIQTTSEEPARRSGKSRGVGRDARLPLGGERE